MHLSRVRQGDEPAGGPGPALRDQARRRGAQAPVHVRLQAVRAPRQDLHPAGPFPRPPARLPQGGPAAARRQGRRRVVGVVRLQHLVALLPLPRPRRLRVQRVCLRLRGPVREGPADVPAEVAEAERPPGREGQGPAAEAPPGRPSSVCSSETQDFFVLTCHRALVTSVVGGWFFIPPSPVFFVPAALSSLTPY